MNSFKIFNEDKLCARKYFYSSTKEISDGHVSIEDYVVCEKIWDKFKMKKVGLSWSLFKKRRIIVD